MCAICIYFENVAGSHSAAAFFIITTQIYGFIKILYFLLRKVISKLYELVG